MRMRIGMSAIAISAMLTSGALADGIEFPLDASSETTTLELYTEDSNDAYSGGRGMVFHADESLLINGAALYTESSNGLNATFELYEIETTNGNVLDGASLVRSSAGVLQGDLGFHGVKFDQISLSAGQDYLIRVLYDEPADENWFFDFDPEFFGDAPVDLDAVTLIDGTAGGDTTNFVAPYMSLQIVPAPGALALLGVAGLAGRRRRRS